jgi:hypothetical protein
MISIVSQPQKFSPTNIANFNISSNRANLSYFDVKVLNIDNSVIARQKYYPLPNYTSGATIDLSSVLGASVDYQLLNNSNIIDATPNMLLTYKLNITENYLTGNTIVSGSTLTTGAFNVWNGELKRTDVADFNYQEYAISSAATIPLQFLTDKPLVNNIYQDSTEYLYFLNDGLTANVKLDFYAPGNKLIKTMLVTGITSTMSAARLNISPTNLSIGIGVLPMNEFKVQFTAQFGTSVSILDASYFNVTLVGAASGRILSETRTYIIKSTAKCKQTLQLIFSNSLGGYDSLMCSNPQESISTERTTINKYPYQLNASGAYTDLNNGIYNETTSIINSTSTSTYTCITDVLSDASAKWLRSIITAEKVYLRLSNGRLYPVSIANSSYSVQLKKYSTNNNRLTIQFKSDIAGLFD